MKIRSLVFLLLIFAVQTMAQSRHGRLKVTADHRYLQYEDGTPFFWLGDTAWELFHRLTLAEIGQYLDNRAAKGFSVIQAVALAEFDGLRTPNQYGQVPLKNLNPATPDDKYFQVIDSTIKMAATRGLFIGLLPTWGDKVTKNWGEGPVVFDSVSAYIYGKWIGNRYRNADNVIWILGGDRPAVSEGQDFRPVWRAMARGIKQATGGRCLIAYHPSGGSFSSQWLQNEDWLDVNMFQSGHGSGHDVACWEFVKKDRALQSVKPTMDAEPNYEDHPVNPWPKWSVDNGYFRDYDVRKQLYRSVFAGACGVTYGHHAVWQFMSAREEAINYPDRGWINAMDRPGAFQAGYLRKLMAWQPVKVRVPDSSIIVGDSGQKGEHMEAFRSEDGHLVMIYLPVGKTVAVRVDNMKSGEVKGSWYNPRKGTWQPAVFKQSGTQFDFTSPATGPGNDWVLVITDRYKFPAM